MTLKRIFIALIFLALLGGLAVAGTVYYFSQDLPKMITMDDFKPLLVSEVYDRNDKKIGEFYRERRKITKSEDIPDIVKQAVISSEDASFYKHKGVNVIAIVRAMMANIKAGRKVQGGSTITQQVAKRIVLKDKSKKYSRKIKEAILARRMEENLNKEQILFLYLNEIYFGQGAYGVAMASEIYFRKPLSEITIPEAALLAGLPQAPSRYTPIYKPKSAKNRQVYVLNRMADEGYITKDQAKKAINEELKVYTKKNYEEQAPYFLETLRQTLVKHLTETALLDEGLKIYTGLDIDRQMAAQKQVRKGLEDLDKRQGYRGAINNITDAKQVSEFLLKTRDKLISEFSQLKIIKPDGTIRKKTKLNLTGKDEEGNKLPNIPKYVKKGDIVQAIVTKVDDKHGLTTVRFAENKGLIDIESMMWARKPNPKISKKRAKNVRKPSEALKKGDIILVKVVSEDFKHPKRLKKIIESAKSKDTWPKNLPVFSEHAEVHLEQEPIAQGALLSLGNNSGDILAMVGGYDFKKSKFNCSIQAARQSGSSFKAFVYAAALDHGYTPASILIDAPLVYKQSKTNWKPSNYVNKFQGDILFRSSFAQSLNIPTVKLIEDVGVTWVADYSKRLGVHSPLNMDYTLALGSSSVTLYEMTKAFSHFPRLGKKLSPTLIHKVENQKGEVVLEKLSLDDLFGEEIDSINKYLAERKKVGFSAKTEELEDPNASISNDDVGEGEEKEKTVTYRPRLFFDNEEQLIKPTTAYLTTTILKAAITDPKSTGLRASNLGRPAAGKTGTSSDEYDAWFIGYTPQITTGVWVGYLSEKSLGAGEGGGKSALPIWLDYMKDAHEELEKMDFKVPSGITFANIDRESGRLAAADSEPKTVIRQAFVIGTEPTSRADEPTVEDTKNFYKDDLAE